MTFGATAHDHLEILPLYTRYQQVPYAVGGAIIQGTGGQILTPSYRWIKPTLEQTYAYSKILGIPLYGLAVLVGIAVGSVFSSLALVWLCLNWVAINPILILMDLVSYPIRYLVALSLQKIEDGDDRLLGERSNNQSLSFAPFLDSCGFLGLLYLILCLV